MPAESHQHGEAATPELVIELVIAIVGEPTALTGAQPATLADLGISDELAIYDVLAAVAEELGERNLIPDGTGLDEITPASSLFEFASAVAAALGYQRHDDAAAGP